MSKKKVALVCDWLTNVGGAEKVLLRMHKLYPDAPIYTSKYSRKGIDWFDDADIRTGWLQVFPVFLRRVLGPFRQRYFSHLDLSEYDLIISVTGAEAKAVKSGKWLHEHGKKSANPKGIHISYCHVPTQYYWQLYDNYIENPGFGALNPLMRVLLKLIIKPLRRADLRAAKRPDYYITISDYAKEAMVKYYEREATIIHPPVETEDFKQGNNKIEKSQMDGFAQLVENFDLSKTYITTARQVNWKRLDLAVKACLATEKPLLIVGEGPEHNKLVRMAGNSELIKFLPLLGKKELAYLLSGTKGYLFPSLEPFGIAPVEALAAGCPVIAFSEGGSKDYIKDGENGVLFKSQTAEALARAILKFEKLKFDRQKISKSADKYSLKRFDEEIKDFINEKTK